jgi:hypothetical protein
MFGPGSTYVNFNWFWLLGALLPVAFWLLSKTLLPRLPKLLSAPVMLGAMGWLPPATPLSFSTWSITGLIFNYAIRRRWPGWWSTYNYLTAAALDAGLVISTIVIFFAITLPNVTIPQWWGNVDVFNTLVSVGVLVGAIIMEIEARLTNSRTRVTRRRSRPWERMVLLGRRRGDGMGSMPSFETGGPVLG